MSEQHRSDDAGKRRVLDWIGIRRDEVTISAAPEEMLARISELEAEIVDLKSRRDFKELTPAELEELAAETALSILRTVHTREAEAKQAAARIIEAANKQADKTVGAAEKQAADVLSAAAKAAAEKENGANARLAAMEKQGSDLLANAERQASEVLKAAQSEAIAVKQAAEATASQAAAEIAKAVDRQRREAEAFAQSTISAAEQQAAVIRRDVAATVAAAREAHKSYLDAQERLRVAHDRNLKTASSAVELLDEHTAELKSQLPKE